MAFDLSTFLCKDNFNADLFVDGQKKISFKSFRSLVSKYVNAFENIQIKSAVLYVPDDPYLFYVCFMALLHAGINVVLPSYISKGDLSCFEKNGQILLTTKSFHKKNNVIDLYKLKCPKEAHIKPITSRSVSFFTSGSTSAPKEIIKNFEMLKKEVAFHSKMQQDVIKQNPVLISSVMPYHMYGMLWRFLFSLSNGLLQDLETVSSPEEIEKKQEQYPKSIFVTTPSLMSEISNYIDQYCFKKNFVAVYSSGSLLSPKTSEMIYQTFGVSPFEIFGSTETGGIAWRQQLYDDKWHIFDDVQVKTDLDHCLIADSDFCFIRPCPTKDVVELEDAQSFVLKGRLDRLVKIAENRIFLPEMEEKITQMKFVKDVYLLPLEIKERTILGAVISLNEEGRNFLRTFKKKELVFQIQQYLSTFYKKSVMPKKFRFVNQIQKNAQGKILKKEMQNLFYNKITEPIIENLKQTDHELTADLTFLGDAAYFEGHFPSFPILPGVIEVHFVFYFLKLFYGIYPKRYSIQKLKFSNLIFPDHKVLFRLCKISDSVYEFTYHSKKNIFSSGRIVIGEKDV